MQNFSKETLEIIAKALKHSIKMNESVLPPKIPSEKKWYEPVIVYANETERQKSDRGYKEFVAKVTKQIETKTEALETVEEYLSVIK